MKHIITLFITALMICAFTVTANAQVQLKACSGSTFSEGNGIVVIIIAVIAVLAVIYFAVKNKKNKK